MLIYLLIFRGALSHGSFSQRTESILAIEKNRRHAWFAPSFIKTSVAREKMALLMKS